MGGRIVQDGRRRLTDSCQSFFEVRAHDMSIRASSLDQHALFWDKQYIFSTRLHSVVSPRCASVIALLFFFVCTIILNYTIPTCHSKCTFHRLSYGTKNRGSRVPNVKIIRS